jgi:hypothetical protein
VDGTGHDDPLLQAPRQGGRDVIYRQIKGLPANRARQSCWISSNTAALLLHFKHGCGFAYRVLTTGHRGVRAKPGLPAFSFLRPRKTLK